MCRGLVTIVLLLLPYEKRALMLQSLDVRMDACRIVTHAMKLYLNLGSQARILHCSCILQVAILLADLSILTGQSNESSRKIVLHSIQMGSSPRSSFLKVNADG